MLVIGLDTFYHFTVVNTRRDDMNYILLIDYAGGVLNSAVACVLAL